MPCAIKPPVFGARKNSNALQGHRGPEGIYQKSFLRLCFLVLPAGFLGTAPDVDCVGSLTRGLVLSRRRAARDVRFRESIYSLISCRAAVEASKNSTPDR